MVNIYHNYIVFVINTLKTTTGNTDIYLHKTDIYIYINMSIAKYVHICLQSLKIWCQEQGMSDSLL